MHSSVEQERQAVITKLITRFEKENPGITVKQVPVEEDAYNTKVITLARSGSLPEVIETSHDYAKVMDKEQLIDRDAVADVIQNVGESAFYDGVLRIVRTEDSAAWTGVPVSAWIGGIWYRKDVLAKAGLEEPKNWQQLLTVAQKLNDPASKKYGIALPTAESVLTEQSFSQFALSNQANVFDAQGKITLDTPEMAQALEYYRALAANTMPGSNDIMEVKDAFMNGTAPMAIYSTYILPAVIKEGEPQNVGFSNYINILSDPGFWHALWMTIWYTALVVAGSTALGLGVAMFFNREFRLRKTARSLVILSYVTPSISLVFAWKYMFNNGYGIVNYLGVDLLHLYDHAPLWFDNPGSSFALVVLFAIWRYFPYAFISFLAILQTIDKSLYEAAEMDGANAWQRFRIVTLPAIMPVLATVVTLRTIWMFYMFADVYLLTTKVDILGVYLYKTAFAFNDLGKAAAISVVLFIIIFAVILLTRKRVNLNGNK
nr:extracellular solute-binding protein [Citrobacter koseri]